ncbi:MAG TPA: glycosyl hydrolase family 18 protein, partial [Thermoanaerobaculia bacterium]|nr:glycosyl hydrolase family 18 protein [Thermoanaerobaculia bacterium]
MSDRAVFFDPTSRRWAWIKRISALLGVLSIAIVGLFLASLLTTPLLPGMPGITSALRHIRRAAHVPPHQTRLQQFLLKRTRERLLTQIAQQQQRKRMLAAQPPIQGGGIVAAFYAPWQETGVHSLRVNAGKMTHLLPAWVHLTADARGLDYRDWNFELNVHNPEVIELARSNNLNIVPVFSNAQQSEFDPQRVHIFLNHPELQTKVIMELRRWCLANRFQGINVDFENLRPEDQHLLIPFLQRLRSSFAPARLLVSADLEAGRQVDWRAAASLCEFVVVMAYDEHNAAKPGPIASIDWYRGVLRRALEAIPREKLVIGLGNYAYDWTEGQDWPDPMTYQGALVRAREYRADDKPEQIVDFDPAALNPTFSYTDDEGKEHEVWFLDAVTAANQWAIAQTYGIRGAGVWVLGSTDPSIWTFLDRRRLAQAPNPARLEEVSFPYDVEFVGDGEILHVQALPSPARRTLEVDPRTHLFLDESYHGFPTSYVIARSGFREKTVALTIDDGPATP